MQLERLVGFGRAALEERDADVVWARGHERTRAQARVDLIRRRRHVRVGRQVVILAADPCDEHALAVDRDLELV